MCNQRISENEYIAGGQYTIADMAILPWYGQLVKGQAYGAAEFLSAHEYTHVHRWTDLMASRPAVKRRRIVNRTQGDPATMLRERHDASNFLGKV